MTLGELFRPRELAVLNACLYSRQIGIADYLTADHERKSAERMIARGFLTKSAAKLSPGIGEWLVVTLTDDNVAAINSALGSKQEG
jgi:hypothetical protein